MARESNNHRMNRRHFLKLTGIASAAGVLSACVPPPAPTTQQLAPAQASVTPQANAPSTAQIEIIYGRHDTGAGVDQTIKQFMDTHPNIKVTMQQVDNFHDHIYSLAAAGTLPDVVRSWEAMVIELGRHGQFIDIQPLVDATPDFHPEDFYENWWNYPVYQGKRFGVPDAAAPHITFYNVDLFDKAGVSYPDPKKFTWDDFVGMARKLTDLKTGVWGSQSIPVGWQYYVLKMCWQNGGDFFSSDYTKCTIDSPASIEAHQFWADAQLKGDCMPSPSQIASIGGENVAANLMSTGKAAMFRMGTWVTQQLIDGKIKFNIAPEPMKVRQDTITHGAFNAIAASSKHKEEAWQWVNANCSTQGIYNYCASKEARFPGTRKSANQMKPYPWVADVDYEVNWDVVPEALNYGHVLPGPNHEGEALKIIGDAQQAIFTGAEKAESIFPKIAPQVTEIISKA
ncbi:MAG: extracellular solute-binding protein [Chloroflexi bacterium]|nr:extracellular solute-binding protein [Chloroflexota bacterium]